MRQDGRWQSTSTLADLIRLAQSGKCGDDGGLVASGWRPAVASPDEVRGYAKDAAPRGKHAVEKARWGEGAFDEMYDSAYDSADDSESDAAADAAPLKGKRKRAKGAKQRLAQALGEGLVFWCALCDMAKPLQSLKAIEAHRKGKKSCVRRPGPVQPYSSRPAIQTCAGPTQTNPSRLAPHTPHLTLHLALLHEHGCLCTGMPLEDGVGTHIGLHVRLHIGFLLLGTCSRLGIRRLLCRR